MDYFTSDLHFGHKRIVEHTDRGRFCVKQEFHDEWMIAVWVHSGVKPGDRVFHLGDFSFLKEAETNKLLRVLPGQKFFIKGNHDPSDIYKGNPNMAWFRDIEQYKHPSLKAPMVMCHYPMAVWNRSHHGAYHIHGHSHGNYQPNHGRILDVGLDNSIKLYGKPRFFTLDDIHEFMNAREFMAKDHHTERL